MEKFFSSEKIITRKDKLRYLELAAVMNTGRSFPVIYILFAIAAVIIIYPFVPHALALGWVTSYLIYTAIRTVATSIYHDDADRENISRVENWRRFVFFSALMHGAILGSLAVIALPMLSPARQLLLTTFVLIVTTGAVLYVSAMLSALITLISAALLPFIFVWHSQSKTVELSISYLLLAAWIINLVLSLIHHRSGSRLFKLVVDNEILVKALEKKNEELQIADQARLRLLAVTSHDLRQPVHALGLILAHASEHDEKSLIGQHFEKLKEVSGLISEMLLELMDLSKIENGGAAIRIEEVCLNALLMQLRTSHEPIAKTKEIFLEVMQFEETWVLADGGLLRRMLLNLLSNAIKYTIAGGVIIKCELHERHVFIKIEDTGIGIPSAKLDEIFQPYVRINPAISSEESVGLGLSIVHRAALIQGFEIKVSSVVGSGSIFELRVPRAIVEKPTCQSGVVSPNAMFREENLIAVVDDDFFALEALVMLLDRWGYSAVSAESIDGLKRVLVGKVKPKLIIADNNLSLIEFGPAAIQKIREQFNDFSIPGIVLTGDTKASVDGLSLVELAHKPIRPLVLKELIARMVSLTNS